MRGKFNRGTMHAGSAVYIFTRAHFRGPVRFSAGKLAYGHPPAMTSLHCMQRKITSLYFRRGFIIAFDRGTANFSAVKKINRLFTADFFRC